MARFCCTGPLLFGARDRLWGENVSGVNEIFTAVALRGNFDTNPTRTTTGFSRNPLSHLGLLVLPLIAPTRAVVSSRYRHGLINF